MDVLEKFMQAEISYSKEPRDNSSTEDVIMLNRSSKRVNKKEELALYFKSFMGNYFREVLAKKVSVELVLKDESASPNMKEFLISAFDVLRKYYGKRIFSNSSLTLELEGSSISLMIELDQKMIQNKLYETRYKNDFAQWKMTKRGSESVIVASFNLSNFENKKNISHKQKLQGPHYEL